MKYNAEIGFVMRHDKTLLDYNFKRATINTSEWQLKRMQ